METITTDTLECKHLKFLAALQRLEDLGIVPLLADNVPASDDEPRIPVWCINGVVIVNRGEHDGE